jgi:hypothetical protein
MPRTLGPIALSSALLLAPVVLSAQPVDRSQDLKPFTTFELNGCFDAKIVAGSPQRLTVHATPEQHDKLRITQDGDTVHVGANDENSWRTDWEALCRGDSRIRIDVTASFAKDKPADLRVRGSGDLEADVPGAAKLSGSVAGSGNLKLRGSANDCDFSIAGSGDIVAHALECKGETEVSVHGSGSATLEGKTKSCEVEIHGSGDVNAKDFACESAEVEIAGSGDVDLAKISMLDVEIHGSGDVRYHGDPAMHRVELHGSGRLQKQ